LPARDGVLPRTIRFPMQKLETPRQVRVSTITSTSAASAKALVAPADRVGARSGDDPAPLADLGPQPAAAAQRAQRIAHARRSRWTSAGPEDTSAPSTRRTGPLAIFSKDVIVQSPISPPRTAYVPA